MLAISNRLFKQTISVAGAALIALPLLAHDIVLPGVAEDQFDDAVSLDARVDAMVQAVAEEDGGAFVDLFTKLEDGSFYDNEGTKFEGSAAILARMGQLFEIAPDDAIYTASTPRIPLRSDGDMDTAWLAVDWSWAVWEGHASALMKREEGEWRFFRIDFFGVKLVIPDADMDPQPANAAIASVAGAVDQVAAAIAACDIDSIGAALAAPAFEFIEKGMSAADPKAAMQSRCDTGAFDDFDPAAAVIYIDAQAGAAVVYDPADETDPLHILLHADGDAWLVAAAAVEPLDVSARGMLLGSWARFKGDR
ncbi:MAG: hypothetical protein ABGY41_19915 [Candidatus Poribacteria bacterium]